MGKQETCAPGMYMPLGTSSVDVISCANLKAHYLTYIPYFFEMMPPSIKHQLTLRASEINTVAIIRVGTCLRKSAGMRAVGAAQAASRRMNIVISTLHACTGYQYM